MSRVLLEVGKSVLSTSSRSLANEDHDMDMDMDTDDEKKTSQSRLEGSKGRRASDNCLREALEVSVVQPLGNSHSRSSLPPASGMRESPCAREGAPADENLLLQNADLQRKLEILQRGVVESMKGNKARFMGNGSFKRKNSATAARPTPAGDSYETLRAAFEKKRAQLEEVEAALADMRYDNESKARQLAQLEAMVDDFRAQVLTSSTNLDTERTAREAECERRRKSEKLLNEAGSRLERLEEEIKVDTEKHREQLREMQEGSERERKASKQAIDSLQGAKDSLERKLADSTAANSQLGQSLSEKSSELEDLKARIGVQKRELDECRELLAENERIHNEYARKQEEANEKRQDGVRQRILGMWSDHQDHKLRSVLLSWRRLCLDNKEHNSELQREISKRDAEIHEAKRQCSELKVAMDRAVAEHKTTEDSLREQMEDLEKRLSTSTAAQAEKSALLKLAQEELENVKKENAIANDALDRADKMLKAKQARSVEMETAAKNADFFRKREETLIKEIAELQKENEALQRRISTMAKDHSLHKKKLDEAEKEAANARKLCKKEAEMRRALEETHSGLESKISALDAALKAKEAEFKEMLLREKERANKAEKMRSQAQDEAEELAAAKARVDDVNRKLEQKITQPNTDQEKKHRDEIAKLNEKCKSIEANIRKDLETKHKAEQKELNTKVEQYRDAAMDAARDVRKSVRMLVTAPKVAINIGGNEKPINGWVFPFQTIKDAVCDEIMPRFSKCIAVSEDYSDQEVKGLVQQSVEELALTLQSKVYELMPQAEGTCNWDGFGAKRGSIGN